MWRYASAASTRSKSFLYSLHLASMASLVTLFLFLSLRISLMSSKTVEELSIIRWTLTPLKDDLK